MDTSLLTKLNKEESLNIVIEKLFCDKDLNFNEKIFILTISLDFFKEFEIKKNKIYFELGYYIILKYSFKYGDYRPLYDIAFSIGFYPIINVIEKLNLVEDKGLSDLFAVNAIKRYRYKNVIETSEQLKSREEIASISGNFAYIAPTSYGKSTIMIENIMKFKYDKSVIIVPTKSLLMQTFRNLKSEFENNNVHLKLITHDEMYNEENKFVAVLTQERALRLLSRNGDLYFDSIFIDEAHNMFSGDSRARLLARLVRINYIRKNSFHLSYFSPLIESSENLQVSNAEMKEIKTTRINFNLKEIEIKYFTQENKLKLYNRFLDKFYNLEKNEFIDYFDYIQSEKGDKKLIYLNSPKKIEEFSKDLYEKINIGKIESKEINLIKDQISKFLHPDFYINKLIDKGIIYLHGKVPDFIKDYLEYKFKEIKDLRYISANSVVLEGVNLPIDSMYILDSYGLTKNKLINLVGRINRLNSIFGDLSQENLHKLLSEVTFIECKHATNDHMRKIKDLRTFKVKDKVENYLLEKFNLDKVKDEKKQKIEEILKEEDNLLFMNEKEISEEELLHYKLVEIGISNFFNINLEILRIINNRLKEKFEEEKEIIEDCMKKIHVIFFEDMERFKPEYYKDFEVERLKHKKTMEYYGSFIKNVNFSMKDRVDFLVKYWVEEVGNKKFYIGRTFGEHEYYSENYSEKSNKAYIIPAEKNKVELINLAIIKIKMEEEFLSFKLMKFIEFLYYYKIVNKDQYNIMKYGTSDNEIINYIQLGINRELINVLKKNNIFEDLIFNSSGNIIINPDMKNDFQIKFEKLEDLHKFEITKYIMNYGE